MNNLIKSQISFNAKFNIVIINFSIFAIFSGLLITSDNNENLIILLLILLFMVNSLLILFLINWVLRRVVFCDFYLNDNISGVEVLNLVSKELKISLSNIEGNIYYMSYVQSKIFGNNLVKDVFFIIEGKRILLNIRNRNDSIFIYKEDYIEKNIKKILNANSQLSIK